MYSHKMHEYFSLLVQAFQTSTQTVKPLGLPRRVENTSEDSLSRVHSLYSHSCHNIDPSTPHKHFP